MLIPRPRQAASLDEKQDGAPYQNLEAQNKPTDSQRLVTAPYQTVETQRFPADPDSQKLDRAEDRLMETQRQTMETQRFPPDSQKLDIPDDQVVETQRFPTDPDSQILMAAHEQIVDNPRMATISKNSQVQPERSQLSGVIEQIKSLRYASASSDGLANLIYERLEIQSKKYKLQDRAAIRCSLKHGFAFGLEGMVTVVLPPCQKDVRFPGEIINLLVQFEDDLLTFTSKAVYYISLEDLSTPPHFLRLQANQITAVAVIQSSKELLLGFRNGEVQINAGFMEETREWESSRTFPSGLENYEDKGPFMVEAIYAIEEEPWFVAKYKSFAQAFTFVWSREDATLLYRIEHKITPDIPALLVSNGTSIITRDLKLTVDSAGLTCMDIDNSSLWMGHQYFRLEWDNGTWHLRTSLSKLDYLEQKARGNHCATLRLDDFCVFFLPSNRNDGFVESMNKDLEGDKEIIDALMQFNTNFDYQDYSISEDGLYLCLIGRFEVTVLTLSSIDTKFTHALHAEDVQTEKRALLHFRFGEYYNQRGQVIIPKEESKKVEFSTDKEFYGILENQFLSLFKCSNGENVLNNKPGVEKWVLCNNELVLISKDKFEVCKSLSTSPLKFEEPVTAHEITSHTQFFWKAGSELFAFTTNHCTRYLHSGTYFAHDIPEGFEKVMDTNSSNCDFLLVYADSTRYYNSQKGRTSKPKTRYDDLMPFSKGKLCAAVAGKVTYVLSLPKMAVMLQFRWGSVLAISGDQDVFWSYSIDPEDEKFGIIKVWDLKMGIYTKTIDTGLSVYKNMMKQKHGTVFSSVPTKAKPQLIEFQQGNYPIIRKYWNFDFSETNSNHNFSIHLEKLFGAESLAAYSCSFKRLRAILLTHKDVQASLDRASCRVVFYPHTINILHFLVELNYFSLIVPAFRLSAKFLKGAFGTPISLCFEQSRKQRRECFDALLEGLLVLKDSDPEEFFAALFQLSDSDDFQLIIESQSRHLGTFLESVLLPLPSEVVRKPITVLPAEIPLPLLQTNLLQPELPNPRRSHQPFHTPQTLASYALVCPIGLHLSMKDQRGKALLRALRDSDPTVNALNEKMIECLAALKWNRVRVWWQLLSAVYFILLVQIVCRTYEYGDQTVVGTAILVLNSFFCLIEVAQIWVDSREYVKDYWNFVDIVRIMLTFPFAVASLRAWLTFLVVLVSAVRGLTIFKTIDRTRFLVKMILKVCQETAFFVIIFIYSILSFGVLLKTSEGDTEDLNFFDSWRESFEISMGVFDTRESHSLKWMVFFAACVVNVIWMLNMLISILGTAYDSFMAQIQAEDVRAQLELVVEMESFNFFRKSSSELQYLFIFEKKPNGENLPSKKKAFFARQGEWKSLKTALSNRIDGVEKKLEEMMQILKELAANQSVART